MEDQLEEINLYDYYKVIVKRKNIIIFITLIATILSFIISYFSPKIYESQSVVRISSVSTLSSNEDAAPLVVVSEAKLIIEDLKQRLKQRNFEKFDGDINKQIVDLNILDIGSLGNSFKLVVQTKTNPKLAVEVSNKTLSYLQNNDFIKSEINKERTILTNKISKTKETLEKAIKIKNNSIALLESRNPVGFNPVDLEARINDLENQIVGLEERLKDFKSFEFISKPYASTKSVKPKILLNTILGFIVSLFLGIFAVFFVEWFEKVKGF
jgi:uncharacterized protein involved in exopolysaccharide biosynthesis